MSVSIMFWILITGLYLNTFGTLALLECYACDSAEDAECATKPGQQISVEECQKVDDVCVTVITAGLTRRGCLSHLYPNKYCPEPCDRCNTSLCNRHIFPTNRLRCYQCSGSECIDVSTRPQLLLPCPVYNEKDRCYTNIVHMSNTLRGCEYTNLPTTCPHVCLKCNYNGCNNELTVTETSCVACTHNSMSPNPQCLRNQQIAPKLKHAAGCAIDNTTLGQCTNKAMYGHRENCFTYINRQTDVVQRGCSTTMGFYPTGEVRECAGKDCNRECLDIQCKICNTTHAANDAEAVKCRMGINLDATKCDNGTTACYACEQDTNLRRGCANETFMPEILETCQLCSSLNGCNRWSVRTCYRCNSLDNKNCANLNDEAFIMRTNCTHAQELCVTTIINRMNLIYTVRGCASDVPECTLNDPYCVRCNGSLCNNQTTIWQQRQISNLKTLQKSYEYKQKNVEHSEKSYIIEKFKYILNIFN